MFSVLLVLLFSWTVATFQNIVALLVGGPVYLVTQLVEKITGLF